MKVIVHYVDNAMPQQHDCDKLVLLPPNKEIPEGAVRVPGERILVLMREQVRAIEVNHKREKA